MQTNNNWLNETANKSPGKPPWYFFIIHETQSPNPDNPAGTLDYNLSSSVGSSYNDLIGRDGIRYAYLDPEEYYGWHAGKYTQVSVDGIRYSGGAVNQNSIGIEIDGACDGTPATTKQLQCTAELLNYYGERYNIPRDAEHLIMHSAACAELNPGYRSDARCTTIQTLVDMCQGAPAPATGSRAYRVRYNPSIVRQGPSRDFPEAGRLNEGDIVEGDLIQFGETVEGDNGWLHLIDGWGFMSMTVLQPM